MVPLQLSISARAAAIEASTMASKRVAYFMGVLRGGRILERARMLAPNVSRGFLATQIALGLAQSARRPSVRIDGDQLAEKQRAILHEIATWAENYSCISKMHVFGSIARDEATTASDLDIAFEYVSGIREKHTTVECYSNVNKDWEEFAERLQEMFGHQPRATGLAPLSMPYDVKAWCAIREGREIGRSGKAVMTWTARKPKEAVEP